MHYCANTKCVIYKCNADSHKIPNDLYRIISNHSGPKNLNLRKITVWSPTYVTLRFNPRDLKIFKIALKVFLIY